MSGTIQIQEWSMILLLIAWGWVVHIVQSFVDSSDKPKQAFIQPFYWRSTFHYCNVTFYSSSHRVAKCHEYDEYIRVKIFAGRYLRAFLGVKFSSRILLCVKELTFRNSDTNTNMYKWKMIFCSPVHKDRCARGSGWGKESTVQLCHSRKQVPWKVRQKVLRIKILLNPSFLEMFPCTILYSQEP